MATPRVVETLNVLRDPEGGRRPGLPIVAVDQLVFDRREEALADGVDAPMFRQESCGNPFSGRATRRVCMILKTSRAM